MRRTGTGGEEGDEGENEKRRIELSADAADSITERALGDRQ